MLDIRQFAEAIDLLAKCLPTPHMADRAEGLYYFFKKESFVTIRAAAHKCAEEQERFPTPAVFGRYVRLARPKSETISTPCEFCTGMGLTDKLIIKEYYKNVALYS